MRSHLSYKCSFYALLFLALCTTGIFAARPSEELLPLEVKGFVSIPDMDRFQAQFEKTQLGALTRDPVMKPFADDLKRQLKSKISQSGIRLGLTLDDLADVYGGEVCLSTIQPNGEKNAHATAMIVDVTGHNKQAEALLAKVHEKLIARGAKKTTSQYTAKQENATLGTTTLITYTFPKKEGEATSRTAHFFLHANQFVATDHKAMVEGIFDRLAGNTVMNSLADDGAAYKAVMSRVVVASNDLEPELRWFVEPFGYAQVLRAEGSINRRRGKDMLKVLSNQGFDAVKGIGGHLNFAAGKYEVLHRTAIHAPQDKDAKDGDKYRLAARALAFFNSSNQEAVDWIPHDVSTHLTFNWELKDAFYAAKSLVNEVAGDDSVFDSVLDDLRDDPNGPQIDVRKNLVAHLGTQGTLVTDYVPPIEPKSERSLIAIKVTNSEAVAQTIAKALEVDPTAEKVEVEGGHIIWEIINEEEDDLELELDLGGGLEGLGDDEEEEEEEADPLFARSALTVTHGYLLISTHREMLKRFLKDVAPADRLVASGDYLRVQEALNQLGGTENSFRRFSRTAEELRPTYELFQQGRMPESEGLLGKFLNRLLAPEEEGELRKQQIDARKLPDFQVVRRYLGLAGMVVNTDKDGWFITGMMLPKESSRLAKKPE